MMLESWIKWAFVPQSKGRHPFHSWALCRQVSRDLGEAIDHDTFITAMQAAGYRIVCRYGSAAYFDCRDSRSKRAYQCKRFIGADERVRHPLTLQ